MAAIEFDETAFIAAFPAFALIPSPTLQMYWDFATDFITNEIQCGVRLAVQTRSLNLMTAHLLAQNAIIAEGNSPNFITQSTIDKVSVTIQPPPERNQWQFWLNQTPYGQQLLALLQVQSVGGFLGGGTPERFAFRGYGGIFR